MTPHPSTIRARELLRRLDIKQAAWEAEKAAREMEVPDPLEAYRARQQHKRQVTAEEMVAELRAELVAMIDDRLAALFDAVDVFADSVGKEVGKLNAQVNKLLAEKSGPRLVKVKNNDAA
jgi:hypothetical protein